MDLFLFLSYIVFIHIIAHVADNYGYLIFQYASEKLDEIAEDRHN